MAEPKVTKMDCYVCGKRASKVRVLYKTSYSLCKDHGINDLNIEVR